MFKSKSFIPSIVNTKNKLLSTASFICPSSTIGAKRSHIYPPAPPTKFEDLDFPEIFLEVFLYIIMVSFFIIYPLYSILFFEDPWISFVFVNKTYYIHRILINQVLLLTGMFYVIMPTMKIFLDDVITHRIKFMTPLFLSLVLLSYSFGVTPVKDFLLEALTIFKAQGEAGFEDLFYCPDMLDDFGFNFYNGSFPWVSFFLLCSLLLDLYYQSFWFQLFCFLVLPFGISFASIFESRALFALPLPLVNLPSNGLLEYKIFTHKVSYLSKQHFFNVQFDNDFIKKGRFDFKDNSLIVNDNPEMTKRIQDFLHKGSTIEAVRSLGNQVDHAQFAASAGKFYQLNGKNHSASIGLQAIHIDLVVRRTEYPRFNSFSMLSYLKDPDAGNIGSFADSHHSADKPFEFSATAASYTINRSLARC